jgi:3D (Asp-Asp-Asp) domain-containing protein
MDHKLAGQRMRIASNISLVIGVVLVMAIVLANRAQAQTRLWATFYYAHPAAEDATGEPLRSTAGSVLARVAKRDWCKGAIEGTIILDSDGQSYTYNYAGRGRAQQVDCSPYVAKRLRAQSWVAALGRSRWAKVNAPYGLGVNGYKLVPFRTIAVDPTLIPIGTVLYIPAAKGVKVVNASGNEEIHDGYFFAADTGGAVKGNHIDVFTGVSSNRTFDFITSTENGLFEASIVDDAEMKDKLRRMHVIRE